MAALPALHVEAPARPAQTRRPAPLTVVRRDVQLVVNGRASGGGDAVAERASRALRAAGAQVRTLVTRDEDELLAAVRGADGRRLVLVGGDGTVHALANLDLHALPPVALLPGGRANNVASALGIPVDWDAAARLAVRGRPVALDALHVATPERTLYAVEGVSAGFHAAARHRYTGENSADLTAGARALVAELAGFRPHHLSLRTDGTRAFEGEAAQVFLSNLPLFGFGFQVAPMADGSDGRMEAIVLEAGSRRGVMSLRAAPRRGEHLDRAGVTWRRATRAQLDAPLPLVADAQPLGVTTATVTVAPAHLRLVAPGARS